MLKIKSADMGKRWHFCPRGAVAYRKCLLQIFVGGAKVPSAILVLLLTKTPFSIIMLTKKKKEKEYDKQRKASFGSGLLSER
jgi:hypothetical protein